MFFEFQIVSTVYPDCLLLFTIVYYCLFLLLFSVGGDALAVLPIPQPDGENTATYTALCTTNGGQAQY